MRRVVGWLRGSGGKMPSMTQNPYGDDAFAALNQLVIEGRLTPAQAQAALEAGQSGHTGGQVGQQQTAQLPANPLTNPFAGNPLQAPPVRVVPAWLKPDVVLVMVGSTLLMAAILVSTFWTRSQGDIDWSNYVVGLGATALLLAVAAGAWFLVGDADRKLNLVAWPGALGIVGVGQMIAVAMDDSDAMLYVTGVVILASSAGGYLLTRHSAFVVGAILGLFSVYAQAFDDIYGIDDADGDNFGIAIAVAVFVFVVVVSAVGWFLPTRDLTALIAGVFGVAAYTLTMIALFVIGAVAMAFSGLGELDESGTPPEPDNPYTNDVWFLLALGVVLCAVWTLGWWLRGHDGYRVLVLFMLAGLVPLATVALAVEHPTWWGVAVAALGAAGVAVAGLRALGMIGSTRMHA